MTTTRRDVLLGSLGALLSACGGGGGDGGGSNNGVLRGTTQTIGMTAQSNLTGYPIYIYLPPNSAADRATLPVIYLLDGDARFPLLASLIDSQQTRMILVGIGNDANRALDYVPANSCTSGGGGQAAYFEFIRSQLVPYIEANIGGDPARRVLWGHSHGGSFVFYALFAEAAGAHTFRTYLPADASIPCMVGAVYGWESAYAAANTSLPVRLYISYAANDNAAFAAQIQSRGYTGLAMAANVYGGGHLGMIPASFIDSVAFALA